MRLRALGAFVLMLVVALTEGVGLVLLIPLLHALGVTGGDGEAGIVNEVTSRAFELIGLPLTLPSVLLVFVALISLRAALMRWRHVMLMRLQLGFVDTLRERLYEAIGRANWLFLTRERASDLTHVLTSDIGRVAMGTDAVLRIAVTALMAAAQLVVALMLSAAATLTVLACGTILLLVLRPQLRRSHALGRALTEASREVFGHVGDFLGGLKLAKSYVAEEAHTALFRDSIATLRERLIGFTRSSANARLIFQIGAAVALSLVLYLTVSLLRLPPAELLVLIVIFARLLPMFLGVQQAYQHLMHMLPAFDSAMALQDRCEAAMESHGAPAGPLPCLEYDIRLEDVSFRYEEVSRRGALEGITLTIPAKQTTAFLGPSGAGKSTLADLLLGLISPSAGTIAIDGHPFHPEMLRAWREVVAYVPQETFLFHNTVRANLAWARQGAEEAELWRALEAAAAASFVRELPHGLDTVVGDRGMRLSGGERQRIALARALLRRPKLLILDEATSALDSENERHIQRAIEDLHGRVTIVIIAHRLSTLHIADQLVVLDQGRVVEQGSREDLGRGAQHPVTRGLLLEHFHADRP